MKNIETVKQIKYTLQELCDQITTENKHSEFDWENDVGKEIIDLYDPIEVNSESDNKKLS